VILPARYRVQPAWVVPAVLLTLVAVLIAGDPGRIDRQKRWLRVVTGVVIAFITLANLVAAVRLVVDILTSNKLYADGLVLKNGPHWWMSDRLTGRFGVDETTVGGIGFRVAARLPAFIAKAGKIEPPSCTVIEADRA